MDVIGKYIVFGTQGLDAFAQALQRQAVSRIDSRCAQDADAYSGAAPETSQLALRIDAPLGARRGGAHGPGFVDACAGAIAVNAAGTNVDHALW